MIDLWNRILNASAGEFIAGLFFAAMIIKVLWEMISEKD